MQIDLDPRGRKVAIFGTAIGARQTLKRFLAAGATVTMVLDGPVPDPAGRLDTVRYATWPAAEDTAALLRLIGPAWLIVDVGAPTRLAGRIRELAGHLHVLLVSEDPAPAGGQVTLVGGGPGRSGLLTVDALEALHRADVVFYDRLAAKDRLAELAPAAELHDVGKSPFHHPVGQQSIEELLVVHARRGMSVVRLKGGDPFVFGRGGEELHACLSAGVPVSVVPGVSSALSVPGSIGIPVTHRGVSRSFTVISGHVPLEPHELTALSGLKSTIVILMGMANLTQIVTGLCRAGLAPDTPAAVVERGFSDSQRSTLTRLAHLPSEVSRLDITSPAVVVIGDVVAVAPQFSETLGLEAALRPWTTEPQARAS